MKSEWKALEDVCSLISDCPHSTPVWTNSGLIVLRNQNIRNGRLDLTEPSFTDEKHFQERIRRAKPQVGDLVFTREAPMGEICMVPQNITCCLGQRQVLLRPDPTRINGHYLLYAFQSPQMQEQIDWNQGTGSTVSNVRIPLLKKLRVPLPSREAQDFIASTLSSLDDKIELNRRMNATLEAMAQTLFRAWFVDFEPVKAKAAGLAPVGLDAETAALFPSALVESELGPIPQGWEVRSLDSVANFLNGLALQKYPVDNEEGLPVIKISQLKKGTTEGSDRASSTIPAPYIVEDGDMLFSWSGSLEVTLWCGGYGALNQHLFKVTSEDFPQWFYYLWTLHHLAEFREIAADKATTMGHIQRRHLTNAKVLIPEPSLLATMTDVFAPLLARQINNLRESRTLAQVRDSLLPRLISGQLRV